MYTNLLINSKSKVLSRYKASLTCIGYRSSCDQIDATYLGPFTNKYNKTIGFYQFSRASYNLYTTLIAYYLY